VKTDSEAAANEGTRAFGTKQYDLALQRYQQAVDRWHDNHVAWYGLAATHAQRRDWKKAVDAAATAVAIEPGIAIYRLTHGQMLYEKAIQDAREALASKTLRKVEEVVVDLEAVDFEKPLQELQQALKLDNDLWRAHYLTGSVLRYMGKSKQAAEELSLALKYWPGDASPWIALAELYRKWDYTDQAIKIVQQATLVVIDAQDKGRIWLELGSSYSDKRLDDQAIEAFGKALELRPDDPMARFGRGQAYFRKRLYDQAKRDLEQFSKARKGSMEFYQQQASRMLFDLAAKSGRP